MSGDTQNISKESQLQDLEQDVLDCTKCRLRNIASSPVFSRGSYRYNIVFIGESPGAQEDSQGIPFCGPAGQELNEMTEAAELPASECYLTNIARCKPFRQGEKTCPPPTDCVEECIPFLHKELEILDPWLIVCLGKQSAIALIKDVNTTTKMGDLVGETFYYNNNNNDIPIICLYHPSYIIRDKSGTKREEWIQEYELVCYTYFSMQSIFGE